MLVEVGLNGPLLIPGFCFGGVHLKNCSAIFNFIVAILRTISYYFQYIR